MVYLNRDCLWYFTYPISQYLFITDTNLFVLFLSGALGIIHTFSPILQECDLFVYHSKIKVLLSRKLRWTRHVVCMETILIVFTSYFPLLSLRFVSICFITKRKLLKRKCVTAKSRIFLVKILPTFHTKIKNLVYKKN